ncbi:thiamine phosphate synthase [Lichenihabitans sp. PAMC28606]|uniref:thiamine phosphate synthase n=1 Tax=Lichenihabitans sp. PAMC28606 TaxID=2880932 RepID=UPI001D09CA2C|nr:thiamine phosphate synthase [Lichenihabitans sp. PAMC28606]UDL95020.1 thiamine phosphate synthase [Lichenihabitans sp. PAMC28606]
MMLDRFYPVVGDAEWVRRVLAAGARLVQLRIKHQDTEQQVVQARQARDLCAAAGATLVLNDFWELAITEGIGVVHLGQGDLVDADLAALHRAGIKVGLSTHDDDELDRALSARPDYVALGPIYPTTLKVMPWAPQGLDRIGIWKQRIGSVPLVAIGGITLDRVAPVLMAGADSVAVVTDVVKADDPEGRIKAWVAATRATA